MTVSTDGLYYYKFLIVQFKEGKLHQDADLLSRNSVEKPLSCGNDYEIPLYSTVISTDNHELLVAGQKSAQFAVQYGTFSPTKNCLKQARRPHN